MTDSKQIYIKEFPSSLTPPKIGNIILASTKSGLTNLFINESKSVVDASLKLNYGKVITIETSSDKSDIFYPVVNNLKKYFEGKKYSFSFPLDLIGTNFQKEVWYAMKAIPFGKVISYKDLAIKIDRPRAFRATGSACGKNPIPIVIPCHRVISSDGSIGGFSLGLDLKRALMSVEGMNMSY